MCIRDRVSTQSTGCAFLFMEDNSQEPKVFWAKQYVEYREGNIPIVLSIPHGGLLEPTEIKDRTRGCFLNDDKTFELAEELYEAICNTWKSKISSKTYRPHIIINHLKRTKLDANRPIDEAACGDPLAEEAWKKYHGWIQTACKKGTSTYGFSHIFDIHGQSHRPITELGYLLTTTDLKQSDKTLDKKKYGCCGCTCKTTECSLLGLIMFKNDSKAECNCSCCLSELIRGPKSLGGFLQSNGYDAIPSPKNPNTGSIETYYWGAMTTRKYGLLHKTTKQKRKKK
eukprot:TRINITY_DN7445_c0_g1_i1.p1 TRINITY_DN7445_c0_g1~~TRINITY_DN7445_c0_g1_i1.p1  ORF type:complete len:284 (+),score=34.74 TRINITY_DN7445_c0_g1_i1:32-883(+)